jgi:signal transduction histidine kinase
VASQESNHYRVFLGEVRSEQAGLSGFQWLDSSNLDRETYLVECPAETGYAVRNARNGAGTLALTALDREGAKMKVLPPAFLDRLAGQREFHRLMWVAFSLGHEWSGRIFLFDPALTGDIAEELHFLQDLVRQVGPAVYNVYLLRRLRLRAGAVERARFARELHDGAVQSLIAVEMQVDVLRRQSASESPPLSDELSRIQGLLREEVLKLRELMQQMKSLDVDSKRLLGFLADATERFQRETGISARFISEFEHIDMPPQMCRELARIVQEGLVNVRKHSQARQVLVRLGSKEGHWNISIEDDGRGFPFAGRFSHAELDSIGKGPMVIKERVRLIEGELTIESTPGRGSRLEIQIPQKRQLAYG